jgi:hypothetical protein
MHIWAGPYLYAPNMLYIYMGPYIWNPFVATLVVRYAAYRSTILITAVSLPTPVMFLVAAQIKK